MGFWWKPKRFVALAIEKSRAFSSATLVVALTLSMALFGAITPKENATAAAAQCPADATGLVYTYSAPNCTATFSYTGNYKTWTVPAGVTSATIALKGAEGSGGYGSTATYGGKGAVVTGTLSTTPGQSLYIYVGGAGGYVNGSPGTGDQVMNPGWNGGATGRKWTSYPGGGGGGASDIRSTVDDLNSRLAVAGGGGGAGREGTPTKGGDGGAPNGQPGADPSWPGGGATQSAGGSGSSYGAAGTFGIGGAGYTNACSYGAGCPAGGGGGGYYGGGSSAYSAGGGSSWYNSSLVTSASYNSGTTNTGNGLITITYIAAASVTSLTATNATATRIFLSRFFIT